MYAQFAHAHAVCKYVYILTLLNTAHNYYEPLK